MCTYIHTYQTYIYIHSYIYTLYTHTYIYSCRDIMPAVKRNREREKSRSTYDPSLFTGYVYIHTYIQTERWDLCFVIITVE